MDQEADFTKNDLAWLGLLALASCLIAVFAIIGFIVTVKTVWEWIFGG